MYILLAYLGVTGFNMAMYGYREISTNKQIVKKLEENGYNLDKRYKHSIRRRIFENLYPYGLEDPKLEGQMEFMAMSIIPLANIIPFLVNFPRLIGHHNFLDENYDVCVDNCLKEEVLNDLENSKLIKKDQDKIDWLKARDNSLKELEKKYDDVEDISIEELYILRNQIDNKIKEKEKVKIKSR